MSEARRRGPHPLIAPIAIVACACLFIGAYGKEDRALRVPANLVAAATMPELEAAEPEVTPPDTDVPERRYFPFLPGEDDTASISIGNTSHGHLIGSAELIENDAVGILPVQKKRDLRYGSKPIIEMIQRAGQALYRETKTRLWVGNIGKREGGDIQWSVSHNSGRDADIAFCYMNRLGEAKDPPDLVPLNGQGLSSKLDLRLDPKRMWIVVKALLTYPKAQVQYLFIADGLKTQVLTHASQIGEPADLITTAAAVLRQPHGSAPHSDHLHLRIFCTESDVLGGCMNTGAVHPWTKLYEPERKRFVNQTAERLHDAEPQIRRTAIDRLTLLDAKAAAPDIARMLAEDRDHADVRQAAARSLGELGGPAEVPLLAEQFGRENSADVRIAITRAVGAIGGREAGRFLARAVGKPKAPPIDLWRAMDTSLKTGGPAFVTLLPSGAEVTRAWVLDQLGQPPPPDPSGEEALAAQLAALEATAQCERLEPMRALIRLLSDPRGVIRERAAHALRMLTSVTYHVNWKDESAPALLERGRNRWKRAFRSTKGASRNAWLTMGFQAAGYKLPELNQSRSWELVRAIAGPEHISYNAQRVLMRLLDHHPPSLRWSRGSACMHWYKWIRGRRKSFKLEKPPEKVFRACAGSK